MRITFLLPGGGLSGGVRVVAIYAEALSRLGHKVLVAHPARRHLTLKSKLKSWVRGRGWPKDVAREPSHLDGRSFEKRVVAAGRPILDADVPDADVVVATWWETAEWAARLAPSKGAKAYFIQGDEATFPGQPGDRVEATYRLPMHRITISGWLMKVLRDRYGTADVTLVPNGVDLDQFRASPRGKQPVPTVGFLYSRLRFKGCDIILDAVAAARKQLPALSLVAFGNEPPGPPHVFPPGTVFEVCPAQDRLRELYARCDAWLFASRSDGFGLPLVEALACRTPIIGVPMGAAPELVDAGGGFLVRAEDAADMSRAILKVASMTNEEWRALSERAHAIAAARSWAASIKLMEQALRTAGERGRGTPHPG
jgi:glycosyltransferase involved in cell wall biosynthesis